ncbi:MAG TPA: GNAT family N-acetyltransferase, partial [Geminicoccaceae bacterium]|nr:GNAT family N-acetyltransferase [Geminicoccaceae bacterium]
MSNPYDELLRTDADPQPVASNPYDELVLQGAEADRNALIAASLEVAGQAPEQVAAGLELARDRGVPPAVALSNRDALEAERQRDRMDRLLRESPIVARWASVPENMGLAQDDLENLARLDAVAAANRQYQQDVPFTERVSARIKEGWLGLRAAFEGLLTAEAIKRGAEAGATGDFQMGFDPAGNPIYASEIFLFGDHLEQVTAATEAQGDAAVQALAEGVAPIHAEMAKLPRRPATQALLESKSFGDTWRAFAMDPLGVIVDLGVTSTVQQLPALAVTVATRNPGMAALAAGGNSSALELGNGVVAYLGQQGVDTTDANAIVAALQDDQVAQRAVAYAQTRAGIVGAFDAAAGGLASKVLIPTRVVSSQPARETLNTFVAQPTLQMLLGGTGEATAQLATEGEIRAGEVFAEAAGELFTAPVEAGTFAFDRYRQRATERAANVEQSAVDQARLNAVTEVAASLKTSERSPEAVEALVRQMREAGQEVPEAVYIDAEQARTYFQQQGLDPQKEMADLVGDAGRATEALALGGDLVVPFERWVARVAKSPHKDALQRLARFDPERLSADELANLDIDALLAEVYADPARGDEAAARAQASVADADPVQEVYMDVLGQLLGAGVERSAAEAQAQFLAQRYATRAERRGLGETAMDVYRLSGLSIEREGLGEEVLRQRPAEVDLDLDPVIDALRTGRVPTDQDIYGPSLVSALVAAGGIRPDSMGAADLRAQDATRQRPGLLNRNGMTLDDAVVWAWENGFLDRPPTQMLDAYDDEAPDVNTVLNLIVDELGGRPTFARRNENPDRARLRRAADELGTLLSEAGLPLEDLTNEQVRRFVLEGVRPQVRRVELSDDPEVDGVVYVNDRNGALIGTVVVEDNPEGLQIRGVELSADMRGQGLGVEVYERLAERAFAAGKPLLSDDTEISQDAVRVWEALERRGYTIERGETAEGVPTFRAVAPPEGVSPAADDALGAARGGDRVFEQAQTRPFFSALTRAVESSKQAKAPAAQWAGLLRNMPGVRQEEIEWSGVLEWLGKQSGSVTREQVVDYLRANELQVEEAVLGDPQSNRPAPYSNMTIPGGSDYRVMLIKLPAADDYHTAWRKWAQARGLSDLDSEAEFQRETGRTANDRLNFTDGHWSDPNVVAHVRFDT